MRRLDSLLTLPHRPLKGGPNPEKSRAAQYAGTILALNRFPTAISLMRVSGLI